MAWSMKPFESNLVMWSYGLAFANFSNMDFISMFEIWSKPIVWALINLAYDEKWLIETSFGLGLLAHPIYVLTFISFESLEREHKFPLFVI